MAAEPSPVYVIDDDQGMLDSMHFLLDACGVPSRQFSDPYAFLHALGSLPPGCVLTDLRMPTMSGIELNQKLDALQLGWPVILMSAHLDSEASDDALSRGFFEVIEKPFTASTLSAVLDRAFLRLDQAGPARLPN